MDRDRQRIGVSAGLADVKKRLLPADIPCALGAVNITEFLHGGEGQAVPYSRGDHVVATMQVHQGPRPPPSPLKSYHSARASGSKHTSHTHLPPLS